MRYTKRLKTKRGNYVVVRVFTRSKWKFAWHIARGYYEFARGNSYEFNDLWV